MRPSKRSIMPLVCGIPGLIKRCSMRLSAQTRWNMWAPVGRRSPVARKRLVNVLSLSAGTLSIRMVKGAFSIRRFEEAAGDGCGPVLEELHVKPAGGTINSGEEILPYQRLGAVLTGHQGLEVGNPVAAQTPVKAGAGDFRMDELRDHRQQIIERQQQRLAQPHDHDFLNRGEGGMEPVRTVRGIRRPFTSAPFRNRVTVDAIGFRQRPVAHRDRLGLQFQTNRRRGPRASLCSRMFMVDDRSTPSFCDTIPSGSAPTRPSARFPIRVLKKYIFAFSSHEHGARRNRIHRLQLRRRRAVRRHKTERFRSVV